MRRPAAPPLRPLFVVALLVLLGDRVAAQESPDFSGTWILESAVPASGDIPKTLVVRQSLTRTNVRGEPMPPFVSHLTVARELAGGMQSETYVIGVIGGTVPGPTALPHSHHRVGWEDKMLVIESGTYTGPAPQTGEWTDRREVWSLSPSGRLQVALTRSDSRGGSSQVTATYRPQ